MIKINFFTSLGFKVQPTTRIGTSQNLDFYILNKLVWTVFFIVFINTNMWWAIQCISYFKVFLESDTAFKLLFESGFKFKFWVQDSLAQAYYMYVGLTLIVLYFYIKSLFEWKIIPSFLY